jgi:hypothetical protein
MSVDLRSPWYEPELKLFVTTAQTILGTSRADFALGSFTILEEK